MRKAKKCAVDTRVLRGANAPIEKVPNPLPDDAFWRRVGLLRRIHNREFVVLISKKLLNEYRQQIKSPWNDFVVGFFALLDQEGRAEWNWQERWRSERDDARSCHYPHEDDHVLRTAILPEGESTIAAEEHRMLVTDRCIHRRFSVHVREPHKIP